MAKYQSYLAGSAFALLLAAHIAMELLDAYPVNRYLWHVNIIFAREARPLLQYIDGLAGGSSAATMAALGSITMLCFASARAEIRLLSATACHVALVMLIFLAARSYVRTYPHGLPEHDILASLAAKVSVVQVGIATLVVVLLAACVLSQVDILRRGFASRRRRSSAASIRKSSGTMLNTQPG